MKKHLCRSVDPRAFKILAMQRDVMIVQGAGRFAPDTISDSGAVMHYNTNNTPVDIFPPRHWRSCRTFASRSPLQQQNSTKARARVLMNMSLYGLSFCGFKNCASGVSGPANFGRGRHSRFYTNLREHGKIWQEQAKGTESTLCAYERIRLACCHSRLMPVLARCLKSRAPSSAALFDDKAREHAPS